MYSPLDWIVRVEEIEMAQEWAKWFYKGKAWQRCRWSYIQSRMMIDGGKCEVCKDRQGYIVHHIEGLTRTNINDPEVSLNHENLSYECKLCHDMNDGHGLNKALKPLCTFDSNGQPISLRVVDTPLKNNSKIF